MDEYVPTSREPLDVCAVFIKEESPDDLQALDITIKIERYYPEENTNGSEGQEVGIPQESRGTYTCEICTKQFSQKRYMTAHRQRHPEFKDFAIKLKEEKLRIEQAKKEEQFICLYCKKEFVNRSRVNRHMKTHTDEKPPKNFICDICHKAFGHKRDVRVHLRVHTGEKPYRCETCGTRFTQLASLQYHLQGHDNTKSFPCDECEKQFLRRISLKRHKKIHSGIRPFKCQLCGAGFTLNRHLVAHVRIHTKRKKKPGRKPKQAFDAKSVTA